MRKLSNELTFELTWLKIKELQEILDTLHDRYDSDRFSVVKHIAYTYNDKQILPLLEKYIKKEEKLKK